MTLRYAVGQLVWYLWINPLTESKKLLQLKIQAVYPHMIIASEHKGMAYCIPLDDEEYLFFNEQIAKQAFLKVKAKEAE